MHASLVEKDTKEEVHLIKDNKTKATTGSSVSSLYPLKDTDDSSTDSGFFVFPDLSVRMEGTYRLKFCLYEMVGFPAWKEEGTSDFQQDSDDNDRDRTSPPLATDGQKAKRRHKSMEREGRNEVAKKSTAQAPKRITYPSTPSQSSTMEVDSSASSVASHPDSSTHATEITRRSSGSSVGHPFAEYRHPESEAETHHPSPGTARRVSADLHGPVNHSMLPPGQPPLNYHYADYAPHRPSQSHPYTAVQHHSALLMSKFKAGEEAPNSDTRQSHNTLCVMSLAMMALRRRMEGNIQLILQEIHRQYDLRMTVRNLFVTMATRRLVRLHRKHLTARYLFITIIIITTITSWALTMRLVFLALTLK
ncbi:hypothetical protein BGW42_005083 [Actinomortierella wolfii]|nr:hypothetical protein BGW42_005083 [Actinomortierella wolfii]